MIFTGLVAPLGNFVLSEIDWKLLFIGREMMRLGGRERWDVAMKVLSAGEWSSISAAPLMEYYGPLLRWLTAENRRRNYKIGW